MVIAEKNVSIFFARDLVKDSLYSVQKCLLTEFIQFEVKDELTSLWSVLAAHKDVVPRNWVSWQS